MNNLEAKIEKALSQYDLEIVAVEETVEPVGRVVRVYIDKPGGVDLDTCAEVNELLRLKMDQEPGEQDFLLEVSSPGIERILAKPKHFQDHIGEKIYVRTKKKIEGRMNFKGLLDQVDEDFIIMNCQNVKYEIPYILIRRANLLVDI